MWTTGAAWGGERRDLTSMQSLSMSYFSFRPHDGLRKPRTYGRCSNSAQSGTPLERGYMEQLQLLIDPRCACRRVVVGLKVIINRCDRHSGMPGHETVAFDPDGLPLVKICQQCKGPFIPYRANVKIQVFCSKSCALTTHGGHKKSAYGSWKGMIDRCHNPKCRSYDNYGGRGISVCDEWRNDFNAFVAHIGPRPSSKHSIDRWPNNDGNYEPGNVRWANQMEQNRNMRTNHYVPLGTDSDPIITDFAASEGVSITTIANRLKRGISLDTPYRNRGVSLKCRQCGYGWISPTGKPRLCSRHGCRSRDWR